MKHLKQKSKLEEKRGIFSWGSIIKTVQQLLVVLLAITAILGLQQLPVVFAQTLPLNPSGYQGLPMPVKGTSEQQFASFAFGVVQTARYIIGAVAVILIVFAGFRMVIAQGNDDVYSSQRKNILYAIIGLALVGFSGEIARIFQVGCDPVKLVPGQTCTPGGFLSDPNAIIRQGTLFNSRTQLIITFLKYFIGSVAILFIIRSGMRMITMGSQEDQVSLDKKNLAYGLLGLIILIVADTAINQVFYKVDPSRFTATGGLEPASDLPRGVREIVALTNIIVSIVSPIAVLVLVAAGVMYASSAGDEDKQQKAKRMIIATVIGIIIMYGAFGIVSTFISGRFEGGTAQTTQPTGSTLNTPTLP